MPINGTHKQQLVVTDQESCIKGRYLWKMSMKLRVYQVMYPKTIPTSEAVITRE
jgi:hypothetical protein